MKSRNRLPCVYIAQSATTRKVYIGQSKPGLTKRKSDHKRDRFTKKDKFHTALLELGPDDFFWEILFVIEDDTLDVYEIKRILSEKEKFYIKKYNSIEEGYNMYEGGCGCFGKYKTYKEKHEAHKKRQRERANRPDEKIKRKKYRQDRKEHILQKQRERRQLNREQYNTQKREKYQALSPEQKEKRLAKRRANREAKKEEHNAKRRARHATQREYIQQRHKTQKLRRALKNQL